MSEDQGHDAMVEFLGTFPNLSGPPPTSLSDLSDGVALFEALSEIAPDYFDPSTIAHNLGDNWALKSSNLRKLLRNLEHFYHDGLGKDADFEIHTQNVAAISRKSDPAAIAALFELVAAAAVTCENKGEFVSRILSMTTDNQLHMKQIIEDSLGRLSDYDAAGEGEDEYGNDEIEMDFGVATLAANRGSGLFAPGAMRNDEADYEALEKALADARRELALMKSQTSLMAEDSENTQKKLKVLVEDLQDRLKKCNDELIVAETKLMEAQTDLQKAEARVSDLEEKNASMADDLDVANAKADQLRKAESTVLSYRKKLESVGGISQQMNDLQDQAASYLRKIMELESEVKKVPILNKKLEEMQLQISLMEKDQDDAGSAVKDSASELVALKAKLAASENAKKMYEEELRELREAREPSADDEEPIQGLSLPGATDSAATKEKLMRLEIEKQELMDELAQLKTTVAAKSPSDSHVAEGLKAQVAKLKGELEKKEAEKAKIGGDKDKLEAYTKRTLAKFQEKYLVALQECKAKLKEKQDRIEALESRSALEKTAQKREERLLSSTIYELGLAIMQNRLKER